MAFTEFDNLQKDVAEGRGREAAQRAATMGGNNGPPMPLMQRFVIIDVIFDPQIINEQKLEYWQHDLGVSNIKYATVAPRNSIIARRVQTNTSMAGEQTMVLYPFFPPQLSFPCQPGEHVWVMFEDPSGTRNDLGYWMCRIVTANHAEDVNHTHPHRAHDPSFTPGTRDSFEGTDTAEYEFRNGVVSTQDGERFTQPGTATLPGGDDAYEKVMTTSDGGRLIHREAIPRYRKRPGEHVVEGPNNTLMRMGRDHSGPVAVYDADASRGLVPNIPNNDLKSDGAGMLDLVAGRGQTPETAGREVDNSLDKKELDKAPNALEEREGDVDYSSDRSRVLIMQRLLVDEKFELVALNKEFDIGEIQGGSSEKTGIGNDVDSPDGDGALVLKTDKVRVIARSDIEFVVTGYTRVGDKMVATTDPELCCAIVLKQNGDIVLRPSKLGYLKLGGDAADKAILCSDIPATGKDGIVEAPPLITTMGGLIGGSVDGKGALASGQGRFSKKVLIL